MSNSLKNRLKLIAASKGMSIRAFEAHCGLGRGNIGNMDDNTNLGADNLSKIIDTCGDINPDWLLTGKEPMLKQGRGGVASKTAEGVGIPLIPVEAFCGYGTEVFDDLQIEEYYLIREFKDADFLIRVKGNSMYPKYSSGDIVACKKINETLFFQWNKIYAIYTRSQGVMVKRVKKSAKEEYILLVSDNEKYEPFDVPLSDIEAIALVIGVIRVE